ncbi:MAG: DUF5677 domain-containing protein [Candidatus Binataceae bacterium]
MPTNRFTDFFDPDLSKVSAKERIDASIALIEETRNYGHALFARCACRPEGGDENIAILFLYYHLLEMLDAVGVLVAESAPVPAELQVRAIFEALLALSYMLQGDTVRRAHAYWVAAFADRIKFYETLDPSTPAGERYLAALKSDPNCATMQIAPPRPEAIANLKSGLAQPGYAEAYTEYRRLSRRRPADWYQLFGGPRNLRELAREIAREGTYEVLYGEWSILGHGKDALLRNLVGGRTGGPAVRAIRNPETIPQTVSFAADFTLEATRLMLQRYRPGEANSARRMVRERVSKFALCGGWRNRTSLASTASGLDVKPTPLAVSDRRLSPARNQTWIDLFSVWTS